MRRALIVCALITSACGGDSPTAPTPPPPAPQVNRAPSVTASVSPTFGIDQLTTFTFSAQGSDPDGDAVTYRWNIAGGAYDGQPVRLTFNGPGTGTASVTATDSRGATTTAQTPTLTVGSMTGTWRGTFADDPGWILIFRLEQIGGVVRGTFTDNFYGAGTTDPGEPGKIDPNGNVEMRTKIGPFGDTYFRGAMEQSGLRVIGRYSGNSLTRNNAELVLTRQ